MGVISQAWTDYAVQVLPPTCPAVQRQETRRAFYAGAVALFSSIMGILEPGAEATEKDLDRKSTRLNSSHIQKSRMPSSA